MSYDNGLRTYLLLQSGLGLKEYLDFNEDLGMQSIMGVWAGKF